MEAIFKVGRLILGIAASLVLVTSVLGQSSGSTQSNPAAKQAVRQLEISNKPWNGDFDQMLERRIIRVAVPYSRTLCFNDRGHERGITAETVREFERWINKKYAKRLGKRPLYSHHYPHDAGQAVPGYSKGAWRYSWGQHHGYRGSIERC